MFTERAKRRKLRRLVTYVVVGGTLVGSIWGIFYSPILRIAAVEVAGTEVLDAELVRDSAEEWLGGRRFLILPKAHVLLYQRNGLAEFLQGRFLRIASSTIATDIRQHVLRIDVREREPEGFWCPAASSNECFLFDAQGILFEKIAQPQGSGGLVVKDERKETFQLGDRAAPAEWIAFMQSFANTLAPDAWIKNYVIESESLTAGYVRAQTGGGWDVLINVDPAAVQSTAETVKELLENEIKENASRLEYIDLRVPGRAYYKLRSSISPAAREVDLWKLNFHRLISNFSILTPWRENGKNNTLGIGI